MRSKIPSILVWLMAVAFSSLFLLRSDMPRNCKLFTSRASTWHIFIFYTMFEEYYFVIRTMPESISNHMSHTQFISSLPSHHWHSLIVFLYHQYGSSTAMDIRQTAVLVTNQARPATLLPTYRMESAYYEYHIFQASYFAHVDMNSYFLAPPSWSRRLFPFQKNSDCISTDIFSRHFPRLKCSHNKVRYHTLFLPQTCYYITPHAIW